MRRIARAIGARPAHQVGPVSPLDSTRSVLIPVGGPLPSSAVRIGTMSGGPGVVTAC